MSRIQFVLQDSYKKDWLTILKEVLHLWMLKKEFPMHYGGKFLYRKDIVNYKDYISVKEFEKIHLSNNLHPLATATTLRNKLSFALYSERVGLKVPQMLGYNFENLFFTDARPQRISRVTEMIAFFKSAMDRLNTHEIFIKPIGDMGGSGCMIISSSRLAEDLEKYYEKLISGHFIFQERVIQHPAINEIYANSLNTIRFDTYIDKSHKVHLMSSFMRFGANNSQVDNGSAGGIWIGVDLENGLLKEFAFRALKFGGHRLSHHPDTNFCFHNFKIPYYEEAKQLVLEAVECIPDKLIGWDIAITPSGPILIEGNDNPSVFTSDTTYGGYLKLPIFHELLERA